MKPEAAGDHHAAAAVELAVVWVTARVALADGVGRRRRASAGVPVRRDDEREPQRMHVDAGLGRCARKLKNCDLPYARW